jgi:hypothetical protein
MTDAGTSDVRPFSSQAASEIALAAASACPPEVTSSKTASGTMIRPAARDAQQIDSTCVPVHVVAGVQTPNRLDHQRT